MSSLNKILLVVFLASGAYAAAQRFHLDIPIVGALIPGAAPLDPLYQKPYIVVYGRDSCGFTQAMRNDLTARRIPYVYKIVDEKPVGDEMMTRMKAAGLDTRSFGLPVVDVNAEIMVRPQSDVVVQKYGLTEAKPQKS